MNYSKPDVSTLGQAKSVIEQTPVTTKLSTSSDGGPIGFNKPNPAYDLDE
ncbi:MAG: hypothetical protein LAO30_06300 [Acidobacteriia bacterium]|nr:hypothetical protein [Terriglobia bacterium]